MYDKAYVCEAAGASSEPSCATFDATWAVAVMGYCSVDADE